MAENKWYHLVLCMDWDSCRQYYNGMIDEVRIHREIGDAPGIHRIYMKQRKVRLKVNGG